MQNLILTLYIIVCVLLVILILLQSGKEGMGVIFGGGNSSVFGSSGAGGILAKLTAFMAVVFVITALSYTYVTSSRPATESVILDVKIEDAPPAATRGNGSGEANPAPESAAPAAPAPAQPSAAPKAQDQPAAEQAAPAQPAEAPTAPAQTVPAPDAAAKPAQ